MKKIFTRGSMFTLIEIIIVTAIIAFLAAKLLKTNFLSPATNKTLKEQYQGQGIDTSTPKTIVDSTRKKIDEINQQAAKRQKEMEEQFR